MCECKTKDSVLDYDDPAIEPIYASGLHWATFSLLIISALIGICACGTAFYNGITKPLQENLR